MTYNYLEAMKADITAAINDEAYEDIIRDITDDDELIETLNDAMWTDDSITGNGSGSYTFCRATARDYVIDNLDMVVEMIEEFGIEPQAIGEKFIDEDWEWFDVSIRCYLLGRAIAEAIEENNTAH